MEPHAFEFRDILFCFEDVAPGLPNCLMKINRDGVFVNPEPWEPRPAADVPWYNISYDDGS